MNKNKNREVCKLSYEFFTVEIYPKYSDNGIVYWLDFSILESGAKVCSGFLNWAGCMEYNANLHICKPSKLYQLPSILRDIYLVGIKEYGFFEYENEINDDADIPQMTSQPIKIIKK